VDGEGACGVWVLGLDSGAGAVLFFGCDAWDGEEASGFVDDDEGFVFEEDGDWAWGWGVVECGYGARLDAANYRLVDRWRISIFAS